MIFLVPALLLSAAVAPPESDTRHLYNACKAWMRIQDGAQQLHDLDMADYCLGYSQGYFAGAGALTSERSFCAGQSHFSTVARVYVTYIDQHPRMLDERAEVGFGLAMLASYPCPVKKP